MKHLSTLLIFLLAATIASAQTLTYDFSKGTFLPDNLGDKGRVKPLPLNGFSTIRIINVNTFRYKVEINGRSVNYVTPVPSELQAIFRLPDQEQTQRATEEAVNNINASSGNIQRAAAITGNQLQFQRNKLQGIRRQQQQAGEERNTLQAMIDADKAKKKKTDNKKASRLDFVSEMVDQLNLDAEAAADEITKLTPFDEALKKLQESVKSFITNTGRVAAIKFRRVELINLARKDWANHKDLDDHLPKPLSESGMQRDFQDFGKRYQEVLVNANAATALASEEQKPLITGAVDLVKDGYNKITEDGLLRIIEDVVVLQQSLEDPNTFSVVSPPIQINGDVVAFTIRGSPVKANDLGPMIQERSFPIEIPSKGGLKVDFSVGPTVSFGKHSMDEKFYLEESTKADTVVLRQRDNNNIVSPGLAAMMHFYSRSGKEIAFGGMFGIGAGFQSVNDPNFCLYGGVSLILGRAQKIILSTGASFLRVDRLKNKEFETGKEYATTKISLSDVTEKVFRPSLFFSISYNITNRIEVK